MSQPCSTPKCDRTSRAVCDCCKKNLCLQHLNEHNALLVSQLNPLTDEINALGDRLNRINLHEASSDCRKKLEKWRLDCHQKIDCFFEEKCQELDRLISTKVNQEREKILNIQTKLGKLIGDQEATRQDIETLASSIDDLKNKMNKIDRIHFQADVHPLQINDIIVQFREIDQFESTLFSLSPVYRTIVPPAKSCRAMASNNRLLLTHQAPYLCLLNTESIIVKQVLWPHDVIRNMCWSSRLNRFIITSMNDLFLIDETTMSIENVQTIKKQSWFCCTCSNDRLYLSTYMWGASIVEISLLPSIAVVRQWKSPTTCTIDEGIDDMQYNNGTLGIIIRNRIEKARYMELRSCETLDHLWSLLLDVTYDESLRFHCCSLHYNGWLVSDYNGRRLLHITTDGKFKQAIEYEEIPHCLTLFDSSILAISAAKSVNLHKIQ